MEVCRICGGKEVLKCFHGNQQLIELLSACANIEVNENDFLPKHICEQCEFGLRFSYRLRKQSEETEKRLRQEAMQAQAISTTTIITTADLPDSINRNIANGDGQQQQSKLIENSVALPTTPLTASSQSNLYSDVAVVKPPAQERHVSTSTNEILEEQQQQQVQSPNEQRKITDLVERFGMELQQRGVVLKSIARDVNNGGTLVTKQQVDPSLACGSTPLPSGYAYNSYNENNTGNVDLVIAEKRIRLEIDYDQDANSYDEAIGMIAENENDNFDDNIIEVIDDESTTFQDEDPPFQECRNENETDAQDIIEEILSSDEDGAPQTNLSYEGKLENKTETLKAKNEENRIAHTDEVVYEQLDDAYVGESIAIEECQIFFTKEEREVLHCDEYTDNESNKIQQDGEENMENHIEYTLENDDISSGTNEIYETLPAHYKCGTCNLQLTNQREYREHIKIHGKNRFHCAVCDKWFAKRSRLQSHEKVHNERSRLVCPQCGRVYQTQSNLTRHMRNVHQQKDFVCNFCGEKFGRSDVLSNHLAKHSEERDFQCHRCPARFKTKQYLDKHLYRHEQSKEVEDTEDDKETPKKTYICAYCGKISKHNFTHKMHLRIHTQERPNKCETCGKAFATLAALIIHERLHEDVRPYQCEHCLLTFRQQAHLKEHRMIHDGVKPHVCSICNLSFRKKNNMLVHMRIHSGEHPYKCVICDVQFKKATQLRLHEKMAHNKQTDEKDVDGIESLLEDVDVGSETDKDDGKQVSPAKAESAIIVIANEPCNAANLTTNLLCSESNDSLEVVENAASAIAADVGMMTGVMSSEEIEQTFSNVLPEDFHVDNNDVVLVVDDDAKFNSLFIMDD